MEYRSTLRRALITTAAAAVVARGEAASLRVAFRISGA
jgi:hypothetical protein